MGQERDGKGKDGEEMGIEWEEEVKEGKERGKRQGRGKGCLLFNGGMVTPLSSIIRKSVMCLTMQAQYQLDVYIGHKRHYHNVYEPTKIQ